MQEQEFNNGEVLKQQSPDEYYQNDITRLDSKIVQPDTTIHQPTRWIVQPSPEHMHYFSLADFKVPDFVGAWLFWSTPAHAKKFMEMNHGNRLIRRNRTDIYSRIMKANGWFFTGESMIVTDKLRLANGQHRNWAQIYTDTILPVLIVTGVTEDAAKHIDYNSPRSLADRLRALGHEHAKNITAMLNLLYLYKKQQNSFNDIRFNEASKMTPGEQEDLIDANIGILTSEEFTNKIKIRHIVTLRLAGILHYLFSQKDSEAADSFFRILTGDEIATSVNDPINQLKKALSAKRWPMNTPKNKEMMFEARMMIKCWNHKRKGRTISTLRISPEESIQDII